MRTTPRRVSAAHVRNSAAATKKPWADGVSDQGLQFARIVRLIEISLAFLVIATESEAEESEAGERTKGDRAWFGNDINYDIVKLGSLSCGS